MYQRSRHFIDFCIAGFTYYDGIECVQQMRVGDKLSLRLEGDNPHDPDAVAIFYMDRMIGYVPRNLNMVISQLLYFGHDIFDVIIAQIDLTKHPEHQVRVIIRVAERRHN